MKKIILIGLLAGELFAQSAVEIAQKSYEMISGYKSSLSQTTMILRDKKGVESIRKLEIKKLENVNGDKSLINFLYPLDIKDTKLLSYEVIGKDDKQWLYLPALKRIKRISSRNKSGSFMASEFSYEDISSQNYKNYSYLKGVNEVIVEGKSYFKITRIPKDKHSGYSKQIIFIDKNSYLADRGEYFDRRGRLLKKISFLEYKKINAIYRIVKIKIYNLKNGKSSELIWDKDEINLPLNKNDFKKRALK